MTIVPIGVLPCSCCEKSIQVASVQEHVALKHDEPLCDLFLRTNKDEILRHFATDVDKLLVEKGIKTEASLVKLGAGVRLGMRVVKSS